MLEQPQQIEGVRHAGVWEKTGPGRKNRHNKDLECSKTRKELERTKGRDSRKRHSSCRALRDVMEIVALFLSEREPQKEIEQ